MRADQDQEGGGQQVRLGDELRALWTLAWPMILGQLGFMTMGVVDTVMVGRVSQRALAAVSLGNLWSFGIVIFGLGLMRGLDPFFSQAHGADDHESLGLTLWRALVIGALASIPMTLGHLIAAPGMALLDQPTETIPVAASYCLIVGTSMLPLMLFTAISQLFQNMGRPRGPMVVVALANVVNLGLDASLVFGLETPLGTIPALGAMGCASATAGVRWCMLLFMVALGWPVLRAYTRPAWSALRRWQPYRALLAYGLPISFQSALESWAFGAMGLMMGMLGEVELAAHAVALNLAALSFMVVLGLGGAASARVGYLIGAGKPWRAAGWLAIGMGTGWMALSAMVLRTIPHELAGLFTDKAAVLALAAQLVPVAAAFQLFDGVQAVAFGVLRGAGDARWPALANIVGYWLLGLPLAYIFGVRLHPNPLTIWWCIVLALVVVSAVLLVRLRMVMARGGLRVS